MLEQELRRVARERILAFDQGDKSLWSQYVADGYVIATPSGKLVSKKQTLDSFSPAYDGYRDVFSFGDVHVSRDGPTAVMTYRINEYEYWDDVRYDIPQLRKTDTYIWRNNRWLILASQEHFLPAPHKRISVDSGSLDDYVGNFRLMRSLVYSISKVGSGLVMQENGHPEITVLTPQARDSFFVDGESRQIFFVRNSQGSVSALFLRDNEYDIRVPKIK